MDEEKIKELLELMQKQFNESRSTNRKLRAMIGLLSALIALIIMLYSHLVLWVYPWW